MIFSSDAISKKNLPSKSTLNMSGGPALATLISKSTPFTGSVHFPIVPCVISIIGSHWDRLDFQIGVVALHQAAKSSRRFSAVLFSLNRIRVPHAYTRAGG